MPSPTVFISYAHESTGHADRVLALADRLRHDGFDAQLDQYEVEPEEGWTRWMERWVRDADVVLMVCTPTYRRRIDDREDPGVGLGVRWEGHLILNYMAGKGGHNSRFVPVLLEGGRVEDIPVAVQSASRFALAGPGGDAAYANLLRRLSGRAPAERPPLGTPKVLPSRTRQWKDRPAPLLAPAGHCNIPSRRGLPFIGRQGLLDALLTRLPDPSRDGVAVLHGPPGVGKSELAREFARLHAARYPGGRLVVDMTGGLPVELAATGKNALGLDYPEGMSITEQCRMALREMEARQFLLIYDNALSEEAVEPWLPTAGMPCHILVTSVADDWQAGWNALRVERLSQADSLALVREIAGDAATASHGGRITAQAEGLPVQLVPAAKALAKAVARGRDAASAMALQAETRGSFQGAYGQLEPPARLLLQAAALYNSQHIPEDRLRQDLAGTGWDKATVEKHLEACQDLHLLEPAGRESDDRVTVRMHQLFAGFLLGADVPGQSRRELEAIRRKQKKDFLDIAWEFACQPNRVDLAKELKTFTADPSAWERAGADLSIEDGERIGRALIESGQFMTALPWFERAVAAKEQGDIHGRVDHDSLGRSRHLVGYCLSSQGRFAEAQPWFERAVAASEQGDIHGRIDRESLGTSLHQVGDCLSSQ
ncbi:MAG TPA: TIR domain-containing protein, partial [Azospirillaceae bacterium]|nr:TIR domain-containing protein [Azospirillaceae bacterium]